MSSPLPNVEAQCDAPDASPTIDWQQIASDDSLTGPSDASKLPTHRDGWRDVNDNPGPPEVPGAGDANGLDNVAPDELSNLRFDASANTGKVKGTVQHDPSATQYSVGVTNHAMQVGMSGNMASETYQVPRQNHPASTSTSRSPASPVHDEMTVSHSRDVRLDVQANPSVTLGRTAKVSGPGGTKFNGSSASVRSEVGVNTNGVTAGAMGRVEGTGVGGAKLGIEGGASVSVETDRSSMSGRAGVVGSGAGGTRWGAWYGAQSQQERSYGEPVARSDGRWSVTWREERASGDSGGGTWSGVNMSIAQSEADHQGGVQVFDTLEQAQAFADDKVAPADDLDSIMTMPAGASMESGGTDSGSQGAGLGGVAPGGLSLDSSDADGRTVRVEALGERRVRVTVISREADSWRAGLAAPLVNAGVTPSSTTDVQAQVYELDLAQPEGVQALQTLRAGGAVQTSAAVTDLGTAESRTLGSAFDATVGPMRFDASSSVTRTEGLDGVRGVEHASSTGATASLFGVTGSGQTSSNTEQLNELGVGNATATATGRSRGSAEHLAEFAGSSPNWLAYVENTETKGVTIEKKLPPQVWQRLSQELIAGDIHAPGRAGARLVTGLKGAGGDQNVNFSLWDSYLSSGEAKEFFQQHVRQGEAEVYLNVDGMSELGGAEALGTDLTHKLFKWEVKLAKQQSIELRQVQNLWIHLRERERQLQSVEQLPTVPPEVCAEELERTRDLLARAEALVTASDAHAGTSSAGATKVRGDVDLDCGGGPRLPVHRITATVERERAFELKVNAMRRLKGLHSGGVALPPEAPVPRQQIWSMRYTKADAAWQAGLDAMKRADTLEHEQDQITDASLPVGYGTVVEELIAAQLEFQVVLNELESIEASNPRYFHDTGDYVGGSVCGD